jgi:hypothetical protein
VLDEFIDSRFVKLCLSHGVLDAPLLVQRRHRLGATRSA